MNWKQILIGFTIGALIPLTFITGLQLLKGMFWKIPFDIGIYDKTALIVSILMGICGVMIMGWANEKTKVKE